ncbi:hypothetical protein OQA88_1756 [Cercophora sp. LCS_1]
MGSALTADEPAWIARAAHFDSSTPIPNHYIIQYKLEVDVDTRRFHELAVHRSASKFGNYRGLIKKFDFGTFSGYHGELDAAHVQELGQSGLIKSIQQDYQVRLASPIRHVHSIHNRNGPHKAHQPPFTNQTHHHPGPSQHPHPQPPPTTSPSPSPTPAIPASGPNLVTTTTSAWNLARISHRRPSHQTSYITETPTTTVYIIDSGIQLNHTQFNPHLVHFGANFSPNSNSTTTDDECGHGTHVAGIIAGRTLGVAAHNTTRVIAIKVFSGQHPTSSWSSIISALQWAVHDTKLRNGRDRSVINMSLGGNFSPAINDAVTAATEAGITVVVAAGNQGVDLATKSPASSEAVIAVGSIGSEDKRSGFSNYGKGLSVFAPGEGVVSSFIGTGTDQTRAMSGTSMACPHVAGLAAYFIEVYGPHTPGEMKKRIEGFATRGLVEDAGEGSPNRIAFNGNLVEKGDELLGMVDERLI